MKKVILCETFDDYAKLITWCIERDVNVWRCYWDNREMRCYQIDYENKRLSYGTPEFFEDEGDEIFVPLFLFDEFGTIQMMLENYNTVKEWKP